MRLALVTLVLLLAPRSSHGVPLDALAPDVAWQVRAIAFRGNTALSTRALRAAMAQAERPWYLPWRPRPVFDAAALQGDLDHLISLYRSEGYYHATVRADAAPRADATVVVTIDVDEGPPIRTRAVDVVLDGDPLPADVAASLTPLPLEVGDTFTSDRYQRTEGVLRTAYREHGYAQVRVTRRATVDLATEAAEATYTVDSGPPCRFGDVTVVGTKDVDPDVVRRELAFRSGEPFRESLLTRTRNNLLAMNLFRVVRLDETSADGGQVDVRVEVREGPPREVRAGIGYATDEGVGGLASWRHYDFLGGARQLGVTARLSQILRAAQLDFLQPHFPTAESRLRALVSQDRQSEDPWTVERSRLSPRLEWRPYAPLTAYGFYRAEYDSLRSVSRAVAQALPGSTPSSSVLSGLGIGTAFTATDDFVNPTRGWELSGTVEPVGTFLGGDVNFVRMTAEGRLYVPLGAGFLGAGRVRIGTADPIPPSPEIPVFERFYAGGVNSVRGYGRWRIGPLAGDEPLGGRSIVEASIELRRHVTESITALLFVDGGQVALASYDFPVGDLQYGVGFGVRFASPIGPIGADLGFPVQPPAGDQHWQITASVGRVF